MRHKNQRKPAVKPKMLRKASRARQEQEQSIGVAGKRVATETGYKIEGTKCKEYETFFEHLAEGQSTDTMLHDKKTRTYRVLAGRGFAVLSKDDQQKSVVMMPGIELTIEPGITYVLATTSDTALEVFVSQSGKYEGALKVIEKTSTAALLDPEELKSVSRSQAISNQLQSQLPQRRTGTSKAAIQNRKMRAARGQVAPASVPVHVSTNDATFATNLKPSYGGNLRGEPG